MDPRQVAQKIVMGTVSEGDMFLVYDDGSVARCKQGVYGGYVCKPGGKPIAFVVAAREEANEDDVDNLDKFPSDVLERLPKDERERLEALLRELRNTGYDRGLWIRTASVHYNVMKPKLVKKREGYVVVDMAGKIGEADVTMVDVCFWHWWSRSGRGRDPLNRERFLLAAKAIGAEPIIYRGNRNEKICVRLLQNLGGLHRVIAVAAGVRLEQPREQRVEERKRVEEAAVRQAREKQQQRAPQARPSQGEQKERQGRQARERREIIVFDEDSGLVVARLPVGSVEELLELLRRVLRSRRRS